MGHIWGSVFPAVWLNTFSHELLTFLLSFFLAVFQGRRGPRSRPAALWRQLPGLTRGEDLIKNSFLFMFFIVSASFTAETVLLLQFCVVTWSTVSKQPILTRKNVLNKKAKAEENQKLVVCKKTLQLTFQFLTDDDESRLLSWKLL